LKSKFGFESLKLKRDVIGNCSDILNIFISGLSYFLVNATHINIYMLRKIMYALVYQFYVGVFRQIRRYANLSICIFFNLT